MNELIELESLHVSSDIYFEDTKIDNMLYGKYHVLKQITESNKEYTQGNLFILHEDFASEDIDLNSYLWEPDGSFEGFGAIVIGDNSFNKDDIDDRLADEMLAVIDNNVCFRMIEGDYGDNYDVLTSANKIIGFRVNCIGSYLDTSERLFLAACEKGDLEKVRYYLTSPELKENANINAKDYAGYYYACGRGHKDIIKYLLTSDEIPENCDLGTRDWTPFIILCNGEWELAKEILFELPLEVLVQAESIDSKKTITHYEEIKKIISIRKINDAIELKLPPKEDNTRKIKI